jgi:hypothetical protein
MIHIAGSFLPPTVPHHDDKRKKGKKGKTSGKSPSLFLDAGLWLL